MNSPEMTNPSETPDLISDITNPLFWPGRPTIHTCATGPTLLRWVVDIDSHHQQVN